MIKKLLIALASLILTSGLIALVIYGVHVYNDNSPLTHVTQQDVVVCLIFCIGMLTFSLIYDIFKK